MNCIKTEFLSKIPFSQPTQKKNNREEHANIRDLSLRSPSKDRIINQLTGEKPEGSKSRKRPY